MTALSAADAHQTVRSARLVDRNDSFAKALEAGDVSAGHIAAMARHVTPPRVELFDRDADVLLDKSRRLNADDTSAMARRWAAYADDELHRGEPDILHGRRGLWFRQVGDLTEGRFVGAPEDMATVRAALDRLEPPDPKDMPGGARTLAQRRCDALVELAGLGLRGERGRIDPTHTVNVVIDATTLAGGFAPDGRSDIPGWSSVLPAGVQRLLCNSWISRVIMSADGVPLEMGRRARLFSSEQQRAIDIRDGGCALKCCDRPPEQCDAHHLDPYGPPTEGLTDIDNGLDLCRPHHNLVHKGWKPVQDANGDWYLQPP
jgi:hypothetical protein